MLTRRTALGVMLEATYGTDPGSQQYVLAWDVDLDIKGEVLTRSTMRDTLTPLPHAIGAKDITLTFKTELKGSGPGDLPEIGSLLQGCGFNTSAVSGTAPIVYTLQSAEANIPSVAFYVYKDGNRHKVLGARGSVAIDMQAGQYGVCDWNFQGVYTAVDALTYPNISTADTTAPPIIHAATFSIGGFTPVCSGARVDLANEVSRRPDINATEGVKDFRITGRAPKLEFNADAVVEASNPFWGDWAGDVISTFAFVIGSNAGHGYEVQLGGHYQYDQNKYGDQDGISQYEIVASLCGSDANSNDDELVITFGKAAVA